MKLRNSLRHMSNNKVRVRGKSYNLDINGVITIEDQGAIDVLLQDASWSKISERTPVELPTKDPTAINYDKLSKKEPLNYCKYKEVDYKSTMTKDELIKLLEKG